MGEEDKLSYEYAYQRMKQVEALKSEFEKLKPSDNLVIHVTILLLPTLSILVLGFLSYNEFISGEFQFTVLIALCLVLAIVGYNRRVNKRIDILHKLMDLNANGLSVKHEGEANTTE